MIYSRSLCLKPFGDEQISREREKRQKKEISRNETPLEQKKEKQSTNRYLLNYKNARKDFHGSAILPLPFHIPYPVSCVSWVTCPKVSIVAHLHIPPLPPLAL